MSTQNVTWRVRWSKFRGYEKSPLIEFPAMTLLIGRNNVGKTSAYAPLLLLRQTLEARNEDTALLFRGSLSDFGSYRDIVTDHDTSHDISFMMDFGRVEYGQRRDRREAAPRSLEVTFRNGGEQRTKLVRSVVSDEAGARLVSRSRQRDGNFRVISQFLPENTEVGRPYKEVTQLRRQLNDEEPNGFLFSGTGGLLIPRSWQDNDDRWSKVQGWYRGASNIFNVYFALNNHIEDTLRKIAYIGPLRSMPKRTYLISAEPPLDVGRDGESATEVLYRSSRDDSSSVLAKANHWLEKLGYGELEFDDAGDYYQVYVRQPGSNLRVNIADCGMGLSQLLPLLVQGCVMQPGGTLIAQQPEIHLNPAQQDLMTDFLIELCEEGKRVIVETHSEHILGRLRRRIAEGESVAASDVAVYYCDSQAGRSKLRRIDVGGLGEIDPDDWPTGFFNEQLTNSVEMARAQARRLKAARGN